MYDRMFWLFYLTISTSHHTASPGSISTPTPASVSHVPTRCSSARLPRSSYRCGSRTPHPRKFPSCTPSKLLTASFDRPCASPTSPSAPPLSPSGSSDSSSDSRWPETQHSPYSQTSSRRSSLPTSAHESPNGAWYWISTLHLSWVPNHRSYPSPSRSAADIDPIHCAVPTRIPSIRWGTSPTDSSRTSSTGDPNDGCSPSNETLKLKPSTLSTSNPTRGPLSALITHPGASLPETATATSASWCSPTYRTHSWTSLRSARKPTTHQTYGSPPNDQTPTSITPSSISGSPRTSVSTYPLPSPPLEV